MTGCLPRICKLPGTRPISGASKTLERQSRDVGPFDIVIIDELCHPSVAFQMGRLRRRIGGKTRYIVLVHHLKRNENTFPVGRPFVTALERRLINRADGLIVNSTSTLATFAG